MPDRKPLTAEQQEALSDYQRAARKLENAAFELQDWNPMVMYRPERIHELIAQARNHLHALSLAAEFLAPPPPVVLPAERGR